MTKEEQQRMQALQSIGCIVCLREGYGYTPPAVHHLIDGKRRLGHMQTIPLCDPGHHQNAPERSGEISRHPNKRAFEARYGSEVMLLEHVNLLIAARDIT